MNRHGRRIRQLDSISGKQLQPPVFSCGNCAKSWSGGNSRPPETAHDCSGFAARQFSLSAAMSASGPRSEFRSFRRPLGLGTESSEPHESTRRSGGDDV
jgi:hypothetical protein